MQSKSKSSRGGANQQTVQEGLETLQTLIPGFTPNLDAMKASCWADLALDVNGVALKVVLLKSHYPQLDLGVVLAANPKLLLQSYKSLDDSARQVKHLLVTAMDHQAILQQVPSLLDPKALVSVIVSLRKWYLGKDPIKELERDPDLVRRAQENDVPFEPVYADKDGNWTAPALQQRQKRADWQRFIDEDQFKQV
ncbi:MAG: hypothetical protein WDW36_006374 [Sanguina aurantia]